MAGAVGARVGLRLAWDRSFQSILFDRRVGRVAAVAAGCLLLANCSSSSVTSGLGVPASPRVVAAGQPVPKGGGRQMVGQPYKVAGRTYRPIDDPKGYTAKGRASWYGAAFRGRLTSNGEIFDNMSLSAAHPTLPLPSYARVTNLDNGKSVVVRINDRGPFHGGRLIDVSRMTAEVLGFRRAGTTDVRVSYVGPASLSGTDDRKLLLSTYEVDGHHAAPPRTLLAQLPHPPARSGHDVERVMLAENTHASRSSSAAAAGPIPVPVAAPTVVAENVPARPHRHHAQRDPIGNLLLAENGDAPVMPAPRTELAFATGLQARHATRVSADAGHRTQSDSPTVARIDSSFDAVDDPASLLRPAVGEDGVGLSTLY